MKSGILAFVIATTLWLPTFAHPWAEGAPFDALTDDPIAHISAPVPSDNINVATISSPTDVLGTASDAHLAQWQLLISPAGQNQWSTLASGTNAITDGPLGHIQTQTIANGLYDIGLMVRDTSGKSASAQITVAIEGQQILDFNLSSVLLVPTCSKLQWRPSWPLVCSQMSW